MLRLLLRLLLLLLLLLLKVVLAHKVMIARGGGRVRRVEGCMVVGVGVRMMRTVVRVMVDRGGRVMMLMVGGGEMGVMGVMRMMRMVVVVVVLVAGGDNRLQRV